MSTLRRILVDGGSGAGKTTFARRLCDLWQEDCGQPVQLVSLDFFYPGWHGLEEASRMVVDDVLTADSPGYTPWDWKRSVPLPRVALDPRLPLLVEGCGALSRRSAALAELTIWLDMDADRRRERALSRPDGAGFGPWWEVWAAQEQKHWERNRPWELASLMVEPSTLFRTSPEGLESF